MRALQKPRIHQVCSETAVSDKPLVSVAAFIILLKSAPVRREMVASALPDWGAGPRPPGRGLSVL